LLDPNAVFVTTTENVPGYRVVSMLGLVFGVASRSRNSAATKGSGLMMLKGGEFDAYTDLLAETCYDAMDRMRRAASEKGANAVVGARLVNDDMIDTAGATVAYGTAVVLQKVQ